MSGAYHHWVDSSRSARDQRFYEDARQHPGEALIPTRTEQLTEDLLHRVHGLNGEGNRYYSSYTSPRKRKIEEYPATIAHIPSSKYDDVSHKRYHESTCLDNGYTKSNSAYQRNLYPGSEPHSNYPSYDEARLTRADALHTDPMVSYHGYDDRILPTTTLSSYHTISHPPHMSVHENSHERPSFPPHHYHYITMNDSSMKMEPELSPSRDNEACERQAYDQMSRKVSHTTDQTRSPYSYNKNTLQSHIIHERSQSVSSRFDHVPREAHICDESRDDHASRETRIFQESRDDPTPFYGSNKPTSQYPMRTTTVEYPSVVRSKSYHISARDGLNDEFVERSSAQSKLSLRHSVVKAESSASQQGFQDTAYQRRVLLDVYADRQDSQGHAKSIKQEPEYDSIAQRSEPNTSTSLLPPVVSFSRPPTPIAAVEGITSNSLDVTKDDSKGKITKKAKKSKKVEPSKPFECYVEELKAFKEKFGHLKTSKCGDRYKALNLWCNRIRRWNNLREQGKHDKEEPMLSSSQLEQLNEFGFDWGKSSPKRTNFDKQFEKLLEFKKQYGHCNVTTEARGYAALSMYCDSIRKTYRRLQKDGHVPQSYNKLTQCNIQKLESIDFSWDSSAKQRKNERFEEHIKLLKEFKEEHGHCNVPRSNNMMEYYSLAQWCNGMRNTYKLRKLSPDKVEELENVGFQWDINATKRSKKGSS